MEQATYEDTYEFKRKLNAVALTGLRPIDWQVKKGICMAISIEQQIG